MRCTSQADKAISFASDVFGIFTEADANRPDLPPLPHETPSALTKIYLLPR